MQILNLQIALLPHFTTCQVLPWDASKSVCIFHLICGKQISWTDSHKNVYLLIIVYMLLFV